jgi:glycosyltransferase involved in cell wall biosynthesis
MTSKTKVLFIIPSVSPGGIETYLLRFLKAKGKEMEAVVLIRSQTRGKLFEEYEALGIPIVFMPLGYLNPFRWFRYYHFFRKNRFDTVCDFNANFAGIPLWLAKLAGIKKRIAFYRQGKDHFKPGIIKNAYNKWMNRLVYQNATKILANSKAALDYFFPGKSHIDSRFKVIYNGLDISQYQVKADKNAIKKSLDIPEDSFVIGHTGRYDKSKNHETIFKVAEQLIRENPNVYLVLCGPGPEQLKDKVRSLGIEKNVRLLGYRSDIHLLLQVFDVFYFPSITEGQPNALIEAMVAGIPVVASNIEPIREFLPDYPGLVGPFDLQSAIQLIQEIRENRKGLPHNNYYTGILKKFDAEARFNDFLNELVM